MKLVITVDARDGIDPSKLDDQKHKIIGLVEDYVEENLLDDTIIDGDDEYDLGDFVSWDTVG